MINYHVYVQIKQAQYAQGTVGPRLCRCKVQGGSGYLGLHAPVESTEDIGGQFVLRGRELVVQQPALDYAHVVRGGQPQVQ